jgi:hypothetical protein
VAARRRLGPVRRLDPDVGGIRALEITPHGEATAVILGLTRESAPVPLRVGSAMPGEAIGDVQTLVQDAHPGNSVRFGLDDAGGAVVTWAEWADPYGHDGFASSFAATRKPGGRFGAPQHLGDPSNGPLAVDINAAGAAAVVMSHGVELSVSYRAPGGSFGPAEALGLYGSDVSLAVDSAGGVAVTSATAYLGAGPESRARYVARSPLGGWSEPRVLDAEGIVTDLFFDPRGALTFLIDRLPQSGDDHEARVITIAPDGTVDDSALDPGPTRGRPTGSMNLRGDVLAAWERPGGAGRATEIVVRERAFPLTAFGSETVVAPSYRGTLRTAVNDLGQAVVVWQEGPAGDQLGGGEIRAAVRYDPALRALPPPPDLDIYADPLPEIDADGDLLATVRCNQSCKVRASGIAFPGGDERAIAGGDKSRRLKARRKARVKLDFGEAGAKAVREALASGRKPTVSVWVSARGASPRPFVASRRFKIRR